MGGRARARRMTFRAFRQMRSDHHVLIRLLLEITELFHGMNCTEVK